MKRFTLMITLLVMTVLLAIGLAGCGGSSSEAEPAAEENAVSGNWYLVDGSDIVTLKLDASGGGSLAGDPISYELSGESLTLTIDGEAIDLGIEEDINYGTVLQDGEDIFAFRDKDAAKDVAANGLIDESQDTGIADEEESEPAPAASTLTSQEAAYIGTWEGESIDYQGITMTIEEVEMTFSVEFKDDYSVTAMTNGEPDGAATWSVGTDGKATLIDGSGVSEPSYIDGDGKLHLGLNADEGTMWIICHKL